MNAIMQNTVLQPKKRVLALAIGILVAAGIGWVASGGAGKGLAHE